MDTSAAVQPHRRTRFAARAAVVVALGLLALAAGAAPAAARDSLDAVAAALRTSPVYNDPTAENALTSSQADDLTAQVQSGTVPMYIAVLPEAAAGEAGSAEGVLVQLRQKVARPGVYAVIVGNKFRAGSTSQSVKALADESFAQNKSAGPYAVLTAFVAATQEQFSGGGTESSSDSGGGAGWVILAVLGVIALGVGGLIWWAARRSKAERARRVAEVKKVVDEDVTQFGERLAAFDISDPRLDDAGRADLQNALNAYDQASDAAERITTEADVATATRRLEDGRYSLACVEARMEGRPQPQRRPPCFVDPRHGPSTQDIEWAPSGGAPRPVPVCDACAASLRAGALPAARQVPVAAGETVPYWQAGRQYAPYAWGYYSSFGDVLPALLVGTMLGSMVSAPQQTVVVDNDTSSVGGGDFSASDFSSGSFGGGDFGGGDFGGGGGGGDFGGGDF